MPDLQRKSSQFLDWLLFKNIINCKTDKLVNSWNGYYLGMS